MKESEAAPANLHESRWVRGRWGHFMVRRGEASFACEKCVFDQGSHADFCPKSKMNIPCDVLNVDRTFQCGQRMGHSNPHTTWKRDTKPLEISHGDINYMRGGR